MASVFHAGERAVQQHAGVAHMAARVGNGIHAAIPSAAQEFLAEQYFAVIGFEDNSGRVWASLLYAGLGFLQALNETQLSIHAVPDPVDPLYETLHLAPPEGTPVGLLAIDTATRRRMRLNGRAFLTPEKKGLIIHAEQVYANCPKYIQKRDILAIDAKRKRSATVQQGTALTKDQKDWIRRADTFFIATFHPESGADASHRGGNPGFVRLSDDGGMLYWPDYAGNAMFNTLGNIAAHPQAGLLFVDFDGQGDILQITGKAAILWGDQVDEIGLTGVERAVVFEIGEVRQTNALLPVHYRLEEYSRFNPVL